MREIKFRGKRERDGAWVYGDLLTVDIHHDCVIKEAGCVVHAVDRQTVGEYCAVDFNGLSKVGAYEGDLIEYKHRRYTLKNDGWQWVLTGHGERIVVTEDVAYLSRVIGNIHDQ